MEATQATGYYMMLKKQNKVAKQKQSDNISNPACFFALLFSRYSFWTMNATARHQASPGPENGPAPTCPLSLFQAGNHSLQLVAAVYRLT